MSYPSSSPLKIDYEYIKNEIRRHLKEKPRFINTSMTEINYFDVCTTPEYILKTIFHRLAKNKNKIFFGKNKIFEMFKGDRITKYKKYNSSSKLTFGCQGIFF